MFTSPILQTLVYNFETLLVLLVVVTSEFIFFATALIIVSIVHRKTNNNQKILIMACVLHIFSTIVGYVILVLIS